MASPSRQSAKLRFGAFEVDPATFRLVKAGIPIKLPPQPFKVLLLLLERAGEVVNRGEIQQHLWGSSTFVDFERGINFSINQIRAALCDNAETPHYIETLPRVGYRFIAPLHSEKEIGPDLAEARSRYSSAGSVLQETGESRPRLFHRFFLLFGATPYRRWEVMQVRLLLWCILLGCLGWKFMAGAPHTWGLALFLLQLTCTTPILILVSFLLYTGALDPDALPQAVRRTAPWIRWSIIACVLDTWAMAWSTVVPHPGLAALLAVCGTAGGFKYTLFKVAIDRAAFEPK